MMARLFAWKHECPLVVFLPSKVRNTAWRALWPHHGGVLDFADFASKKWLLSDVTE